MKNDLKLITPFKRMCITIGNLPTSYLESMSYYECLTYLLKFLTNEVIPVVNNNSEVVKELQEYVNHYFDNLDVQEEINNKLDDMAESGQLADIIAQYLSLAGVLAFDTLADLKDAENIVDGSITLTLGQNSYNDGLSSFYKIRTITVSDVVDELNIVSLNISNTLIAEKIYNNYENVKKNPLFYGADPTGTIDSSTAINNCIQANKGGTIEFTIGTYLVNSTINLPYKVNEKVNINGNGATIKNTTDLTRLIYIGYDKGTESANDVGYPSYIKDLNLEGNEADTTYCIDIIEGYKDLKLYNLRIFRFLNGVRIGENNTSPADVLLTNSLLYGKGSEYDGIGVIANCSDNNIEMCRLYGYRKGFEINSNTLISRCQVLLRWEEQTTANFDPYTRNGADWNTYYPLTMFAEVNNLCRIIESYCDSTYKFLDIKTYNDIIFTNNLYYNSRENVDMRVFDFNSIERPQITIKNNVIYCSHYSEGEVIHNSLTFSNYTQIAIEDNILKRNLNLTNPADIILSSSTGKYINNVTCEQDDWLIVGALRNNSSYNGINVKIAIGGYLYSLRLQYDGNSDISTITQLEKGSDESRWSVGTVKDNDIIYLCIKNNNETITGKFYIKELYSDNLMFHTPIIKTGTNIQESSHLLSDYSNSTPSNTVRLYNVLF